jgi:integrase
MLRTKSGLPKHCSWNTDRHGKRRVRFRKNGFSTYLTGTPWSEEFMRQHAAALDGVKVQASNVGAGRTVAGSVNALVAAYLDPGGTSPFKTLAPETRRTRRNILENFREAYGKLPVYGTDNKGKRFMLLTREHVQRIVNEKSGTPFAQRNFLNTLRAVFQWALAEGRVPDDPTLGVKRVKASTAGYKTWSEQQIERFEAKYPIGTRERLAFGMLLYTGVRRSDAVKLGPGNLHNGILTIHQCKTEGQDEAHLELPLHPTLAEIIAATPMVGVKTYLVTSFGKPYSAAGFGNWFREVCDAAGCPDVSAHGLRKATARRLAEIGCSASQIASVTGHASLAEVQRYTKAADRKRMAREAMAKLVESGTGKYNRR